MKILKSNVTKKVTVCFNISFEENFWKVAAFVVFTTSIMVLFEIHQRFKGHFLKKLRVSFKKWECLNRVLFILTLLQPWNYNTKFVYEFMFPRTHLKPTKFRRGGRIKGNLIWLFCKIATWIISILNNANILQTVNHSF